MSIQIEMRNNLELKSELMDTNIFSVIRKRHSTRSYLAKNVSDEMIQSLIGFSIRAPSAMNRCPWSFVIVKNPQILRDISDQTKKFLTTSEKPFHNREGHHLSLHLRDPAFDIFYGAPVLIIICAKIEENEKFSTESDCFLAGENLMLAAEGMGLATCLIGLARDVLHIPEMRTRVGIPVGFNPVLPIIVGYECGTTNIFAGDRPEPIVKWVE